MPSLSGKMSEITDPAVLLERIRYRNERLLVRIDAHRDPASFAKNLASRNRSELRRLAELLGYEPKA